MMTSLWSSLRYHPDPVDGGGGRDATPAHPADVALEESLGEADEASLASRVRDLESQLLRTRADLQNIQRRAAGARQEAIRDTQSDMMKRLVDVLDDFDRALAGAGQEVSAPAGVQGFSMIHAKLLTMLKSLGLEVIEAANKPFDPEVHQAVARIPTADHPPGTVVEELAKGYRFADRVLRPAMVAVAVE